MYKALSYFTDLQDGGYSYKRGDIYPRKGYSPKKERIAELSTDKNRRGVPVITEIDDIKPSEAVNAAKGTVLPEDVINPPTEAITEEKPKKRTRKAKKDAE